MKNINKTKTDSTNKVESNIEFKNNKMNTYVIINDGVYENLTSEEIIDLTEEYILSSCQIIYDILPDSQLSYIRLVEDSLKYKFESLIRNLHDEKLQQMVMI